MDLTAEPTTGASPTPAEASAAAQNSCVNVAEWFAVNFNDHTAEPYVRAPLAFVYVLIFVAGLSGNSLVIISVCRNRALQTVRNFFIVSLSCSDLVVCLTSLPITPVTFIWKNWLFGSFLCYAFPLVQGMSVCISTFTLTAVALDRYILIIFPTKKPIQRHQAVSMIISIWALAAGVSVPMVVHYNHFYGPDRQMEIDKSSSMVNEASNETDSSSAGIDRELDSSSSIDHSESDDSSSGSVSTTFCGYFCEEIWPSENVRQIYGSFVLILQFLVPLTVISFCYAHICIRLAARDGAAKRRASTTTLSIKRGASRKEKRHDSSTKLDDNNPRLSVSQTTVVPDLSMGLNVSMGATTAVAVTNTSSAASNSSSAENRRRAVLRRKKRTNRMLIAMVVIFACCWFPQVLMNILRDLGSLPTFVNDQMYFYSLVCHSMAMSSTIWNPLLYSWMNETFRRSFMELLPCFVRIRRRISSKRRRGRGGNNNNNGVGAYGGNSSIRDADSHFVDNINHQYFGNTTNEPYLTQLITDEKKTTAIAPSPKVNNDLTMIRRKSQLSINNEQQQRTATMIDNEKDSEEDNNYSPVLLSPDASSPTPCETNPLLAPRETMTTSDLITNHKSPLKRFSMENGKVAPNGNETTPMKMERREDLTCL